jgi:DNA-binding NtrC family response regulator
MARVLVIDDDEQVRSILAQFLEHAGHVALTASDGDEGIRVFHRERVDLVVTDIVMPRKEGIETIIELRTIRPDLKIIAMSGGGLAEGAPYLGFARQLGADAVLDKPVRMDAFCRAVSRCLGERVSPSAA